MVKFFEHNPAQDQVLEGSSLSVVQRQQMIYFLQNQMARVNISYQSHMDHSNLDIVLSLPCSSFSPKSWILDSGATSHICHSLKCFSSYTPLRNKHVTLPNNMKIDVAAI